MRISVFCGGTYVSGMEIKAVNLIQALRDRGHLVYVVANGWNDGEFARRLRSCEIPYDLVYLGKLTRRLGLRYLWWMANTLARWPGALWVVRRHLRDFEPDVILLFNRDAALLATPLLRRRLCVFHVAEFPPPGTGAVRPFLMIDRWIAAWVGVSNYIGQSLRGAGVSDEKIAVVHNGIPPTVVGEKRYTNGVVNIGVCGQIGLWKGQEDLLEAARLMKARGCRFRLLVFGTGDDGYIAGLEESAMDAGISDLVEWRGFVTDHSRMYSEIDILAVPSRFQEPFGLVAAEAGLNGIPVVATRCGGLPEIVLDGETGFIVEPEDPDQMADRLVRLAESSALRRTMGEAAARRIAREFTVERMAEGHERVFRELVLA